LRTLGREFFSIASTDRQAISEMRIAITQVSSAVRGSTASSPGSGGSSLAQCLSHSSSSSSGMGYFSHPSSAFAMAVMFLCGLT
jgi:hypothetical protein